MLSAAGDFLDLAEAIHAGADACYTKPAEIEAAHRKLLQMLERAQADVPRILVVEDDEFHAAFARDGARVGRVPGGRLLGAAPPSPSTWRRSSPNCC